MKKQFFPIDNSTKIAKYREYLEKFMRKFISEKLEEYYGGKWWKQGVSEGIRKKCAERKEQAIREGRGRRDDPLIIYMDIPDYSEIVCVFGKNWENIFSKYYGGTLITKGGFTTKIHELYPIRKDEGHSRDFRISSDDVKRFEMYIPDLLCVDEKAKSEFRKLITSFEEATKKRIDYLSKFIHELKCELLDKSLASSASKEEIFGFYNGNPPSWRVIVAGGDVRRDREKEIEQALQERNGFRIVCIVAEPGAGKTTAAWRAAYQLFQQGEIVLRLTDNSDPQFWYRISELTEYIDRPFYILIDDLFRYKDFVLALQSINKDVLPITIIATSRSSEYWEARGLGGFIKKIELKLSDREKNDLLKRLGKSYEMFSPDEQHIFDKTTLFLALGVVLTKGKGFHEIVRDMIDKLEEKDEILYRAYEYVCFSYSYNTSIPEDLLANLDEKGRFYRLLENEAAKGIFYEDSLPSYPTRLIKAGHQLIANEALHFYSRHPKVLFKEILEAANEENLVHRRFIARLTQVISQEEKDQRRKEIRDFIVENKKITDILRCATISELGIWGLIYKQLNLQKEAKKCTEEILSRVPNTTLDCQLLIRELLNGGFDDRAFSTIKAWLEEYPEDKTIFTRYLSLVKDKGSQEQIEKVIEESSLWLQDHPDDNTVRRAWLVLIRDKGNQEQIRKGMRDSISWLQDHPGDNTVRVYYLSLVKEKGNEEQIEEVIEETTKWLKDHPDDNTVRRTWLALIRDNGTREQIEKVIEESSLWLKDHPGDNKVRVSYLTLVKEKGNQEKIEEAIEETTKWLKDHPDDNTVREAWLVLIRDKGNQEQIRRGIGDTISWLKVHPEDNKIRSVYLSLVRDEGFFEEDIKPALDDMEQWMKKHGPHPLFQDYLPLVEKIIKTEIDMDIDIELVKQFGYEFINSCRWEYNIRLIRDFADWLGRERFFDEAEQIYERLLKTKMRNFEKSTIYFSYGKMFLGQAMNLEFSNEECLKKLKKAEKKFREVLEVRQKYHMAHAFLAITLNELGENYEAKYEFNDAEWRAPFDEKRKMLFIGSIPPKLELKNILDRYIIPNEIKNIFEAEGKTLSENALVKKKEKIKNRWIIKDNESYYLIIEEKEKLGSNIARLNIYGDYHPGRLPYKIGNFYLEFNRYKEAIRWLKIAVREEPENFTNWWKSGYVKKKLAYNIEERGFHKEAKDLFVEALSELETAWDIAPESLQLPASRDIPAQIGECKRYISILDAKTPTLS